MEWEAYRRAVGRLTPDASVAARLEQEAAARRAVWKRRHGRGRKAVAAAAACLLIVVAVAGVWRQMDDGAKGEAIGASPDGGRPPSASAGASTGPSASDAVRIPAMKLPKGSTASMDMIGLIVYQGRIYTQTDTRISVDAAAAIRGEKLGRTRGNLDEWSKQDEYAVEFASSIGEADVYTVEGYDPEFRIMAYETYDDGVWAELYECLNGIGIASGADVFGKLRLEGRVTSAGWQRGGDEGEEGDRALGDDAALAEFVRALYRAEPIERDRVSATVTADNRRRHVELTLADSTVVSVLLFEDGYAAYGNLRVLYQVDPAAFSALWKAMS